MLTLPITRSAIVQSKRKLSSILLNHQQNVIGRQSSFVQPSQSSTTTVTKLRSYGNNPNFQEPQLSLAYTYDCYDDEEDNHHHDDNNNISDDHKRHTILAGDITFVPASKPNLNSPNTPNYNIPKRNLSGGGGPPTSGGGGNGSTGGGGGTTGSGGGNGKHKCPKCGMSVTFKHGDFEENTFYCATCSGWFLVKGSEKEASLPFAYDEFNKEEKGSTKQKKVVRPQILMSHVSILYIQYSSSNRMKGWNHLVMFRFYYTI